MEVNNNISSIKRIALKKLNLLMKKEKINSIYPILKGIFYDI